MDADEFFGQNIATGLRNITDNKFKEYVKVKMQERIFQAQVGLLPLPFSQNASHNGFPQNGPAINFQHIYDSATQHYPYQPQRETFSIGQTHLAVLIVLITHNYDKSEAYLSLPQNVR